MQQHHNDIVQLYPKNSFQDIFWKSQYDSAQKDLDSQLLQDSEFISLKEHEKYVGLIGDEMHVKRGLMNDKNTGEFIGYCNLGDINNHLTQLKQYSNNTSQGTCLATSVMVIMIQGLFNSFTFRYASFPTSNLSGEQLVPIFYEAIMRSERCGLKAVSIALDRNSVNRKFIKLVGHQDSPVKQILQSNNTLEVYLISDPPHLKTAHNCLSNPNGTKTSIKIHFNGTPITWKHIRQLYEITTKTTGVTTLLKLIDEHIHLNSFSKMRVDLAAEVCLDYTLSQTVAITVRMHFKEEASETANFLEMMHKFFDLLDVTNYTKWRNDFEIQWLKSEFLVCLEKWEIETKLKSEMKSSDRKKLMLSDETLLGLRTMAYSCIELIHFIFTIPGVRSFLSEHISQDPLKKYFGRQRQSGGNLYRSVKGMKPMKPLFYKALKDKEIDLSSPEAATAKHTATEIIK
uniref:Transposable element P transposase n=1 Tax=Amphimedon queenslandica TaxID=400682 RepID=A0A1X7V4I6_AMPQE